MSLDPSSLESALQRLRPAAPDASLLARLEACAADTWTDLQPAEVRLEQRLQQITPAQLPPALIDLLEATVRSVPFPGDENIVRFPTAQHTPARRYRGWWAAAAAVALTGAATALLMPAPRHAPGPIAAQPPAPRVTQPARETDKLIPAGFNRGLSEARDEGVIWQSNDQPHRVLKVVYKDRVTLKDTAGHTYQVEQPRVEYILVPAKTD